MNPAAVDIYFYQAGGAPPPTTVAQRRMFSALGTRVGSRQVRSLAAFLVIFTLTMVA